MAKVDDGFTFEDLDNLEEPLDTTSGFTEDFTEDGDNDTVDFGESETSENQTKNVHSKEEIKSKIDKGINKASDSIDKATRIAEKTARSIASEVKSDFNSELSDSMSESSRFGFKLYVYAIIAFVMFAAGSTQSLLLLAGWIILVEKNKDLTKMVICTLTLLLGISILESVWNLIPDVLLEFIPRKVFTLDISIVSDGIRKIDSIVRILFDATRIGIGLWGVLKSKKGDYFKIPFVYKLFD